MPNEETPYLKPYLEAVRTHGAGFRATLWGSEAAQHLRFDVMLDMAHLEGCSVVDVGCGDGALAVYARHHGVHFRQYTGIDALPEMVERGRGQVTGNVRFLVADVWADPAALEIEGADWMLFSGSLNTLDEEAAWRLVTHAFGFAARGVIFNFLSDRCHPAWRDRVLAPARRFDVLRMVDRALSLTSRVRFRQEYLDGHDATIAMMHDHSAGSPTEPPIG